MGQEAFYWCWYSGKKGTRTFNCMYHSTSQVCSLLCSRSSLSAGHTRLHADRSWTDLVFRLKSQIWSPKRNKIRKKSKIIVLTGDNRCWWVTGVSLKSLQCQILSWFSFLLTKGQSGLVLQRGGKSPETFHGKLSWGTLEIFKIRNLWELMGIYVN